MSNPWLKKNPWLSLWLSGANAVAGQARSQVAAEAKRATQRGLQDGVDAWTRIQQRHQGNRGNTQQRQALLGRVLCSTCRSAHGIAHERPCCRLAGLDVAGRCVRADGTM